ncbi:MAG: SRPBCC family protein [Paraprevotella sp.]|nr:SRPBCC family protein [Paraprevotella sp.]
MSKLQFESQIKAVPYAQTCVYAKLADLNNLSVIKDRFSDPSLRQAMEGKVSADQWEQMSERIQNMTFTTDAVSCTVSPLGEISLQIIERDEPKCIKFETVNSPIHLNLWIQLLPTSDGTSKMKLTVGADLNPFIKGLVEKQLREGVEKLADMLAMIPYGA